MQHLRVAIVGCGKIADAHVEEIRKQANVELVGVCDRELLMAEQLSLRYGLPRHFSDFQTMLSELRPDVVHITTSPQSHLDLARSATSAGAHVFVEKPLTPDYPNSQALIDSVSEVQKKLTIGYSYYLDPISVALRKMISAGVLGELVHLESFLGYNLSGPFGTVLLNDGGHWVHQLPGKLVQNSLDHLLIKVVEFVP